MDTQVVEFNRPNKSVPWGFSIQGGKEFGCPLSILRVSAGSIAHKLGVNMGDLLININGIPSSTMTHQQAILQIQNLKVTLEIQSSKQVTDSINFPPPPPSVELSDFNSNCRISTSIGELPPPPPEIVNVRAPYTLCAPPPPACSSFPPPPPACSSFPPPPPHVHKELAPLITPPKYKDGSQEKIVAPINKKVELSQQRMSEGSNKPPVSSYSLGKYIQNQTNNPTRDNKDLVIQQTILEKNTAICFVCKDHIKGAYIEANKKIYCSEHFCCSYCREPIKSSQFIETKEGILYCMTDFKNNIAPKCNKCGDPVVSEQVMAMGKCWHTLCFVCNHCQRPIPQGQFHVKEDDGVMSVYCEKDYKEHYEIKCAACSRAIDDDDKYLLVNGKNYHVHCFKR